MTNRPVLFVGSSTEGLPYAKAVQLNLDHLCQVVLWTQGVFGLSGGTLKELVDDVKKRPDALIYSSGGLYGATHFPVALLLSNAEKP